MRQGRAASLPVGEGGHGSGASVAGWGPGGDFAARVVPHPTSVGCASEAILPYGEGVAPRSLPVGEGGHGSGASVAGWGPGGDFAARVVPHPTSVGCASEATLPYGEGCRP